MNNRINESIGVGPTPKQSLRVSVATLARVLFSNPESGEIMVALERKATWIPEGSGRQFIHRVQPFGGAVRITNLIKLQSIVQNFRFDSTKSRSESDFRILVNPLDWSAVRKFTLEAFERATSPDIESDPRRELSEEFDDAIGVELKTEQFELIPVGVVLENEPRPTANVHAAGDPTVRIYRIYEVEIVDTDLCREMLQNSRVHTTELLRSLAEENASSKGRGWANAMLTAPLADIEAAYLTTPVERRAEPIPFQGTYLDGNVSAVLDNVPVPSYQRLG